MKKILFPLLLITLVCSPASAQLILDDFNTGVTAGEGSVISGSTWDNIGNVTQNATSITVGGTSLDDNGWGVIGIDIDGSSYDQIVVYGQQDGGNATTAFSVEFTNSSFDTIAFSVAMSNFSVGSLTPVPITVAWSTFDPTHIIGWSIGGGAATGTNAFSMTLDNLVLATSAVPEPSTYALLAGIACLGFMVVRRRFAKV